ncbi:hypothetical protein P7H19_21600 [Paenibacillus larvae]|nr:hypothetical protein [Paenibacillus larvae]MDT2238349.1 hypothetical protein [Paenibacillus larvae]
MLDRLIDAVEGQPDVIYSNKTMRREIKRVIQITTDTRKVSTISMVAQLYPTAAFQLDLSKPTATRK